jgi:hypothetical protein
MRDLGQVTQSRITACSIFPNSVKRRLNLIAVGDITGTVTLWTPEATVGLRTHSQKVQKQGSHKQRH